MVEKISDSTLRSSGGKTVTLATSRQAGSTVDPSCSAPGDLNETSYTGIDTTVATGSPAATTAFKPLRFLQLVALTGFLAAAASVIGKLAFDFSPGEPLQQLSSVFREKLFQPVPVDDGIVCGGPEKGFTRLDLNPGSFGALLAETGKALLLATSGARCDLRIAKTPGGVPVGAAVSFFFSVLLLRALVFGCMLACNGLMLNFHVKCLLVAPSAGSSSVAVFAANFLCSVALSWLFLGEQLSYQFVAGAAFMLSGVALLSLHRGKSHSRAPKEHTA